MDQPAQSPATAREIIQEILRNLREGLEPLQYSTLAPSIYHVYLHPGDMERLRGIQPRIIEEARRALDAEVESLNRISLGERLKIAKRTEPKIEIPEGGWQIHFFENTDDQVEPGEIEINSELGLPAKTDFGSGSLTKRIATRRNVAAVSASFSEATRNTSPPPPVPATLPAPAAIADSPPQTAAFAVIDYEDHSGRKSFSIDKDQIVVGRGGRDYWTDLKLDTLADVSREHFRLRRDPASGRFFLKDLSRLGTTINGEPAPSSIEIVDGEKRDRNVEAPVPDEARIGLAGVLFLQFRTTSNG
jgi:hypothetical protein